jgi:hypothetical protein
MLSKTHIDSHYLSFFKSDALKYHPFIPGIEKINNTKPVWSTYDTRCFIPCNEHYLAS